jgi:hypothetical protein
MGARATKDIVLPEGEIQCWPSYNMLTTQALCLRRSETRPEILSLTRWSRSCESSAYTLHSSEVYLVSTHRTSFARLVKSCRASNVGF